MAVSVLSAAGVVTTQKATAQPTTITPIVVNYNPGATYSYTPKQFSAGEAGSDGSPGIKHFEAATGGAAYSSIRTKQGQGGFSVAQVGTVWTLNLRGANWCTVKNMPCKVTVKVNYHLEAKGTHDTEAAVYWGPQIVSLGYANSDIVHGNDPVHAKSVTTTTTWQGTVGQVFATDMYGIAGAEGDSTAGIYTPGAGQASAAITCSSIVLEFPAS